MAPPAKLAGPAPGPGQLHEAALRHLARFAATEAGLIRVLDRRIQRWARLARQEQQLSDEGDGVSIDEAVGVARRAVREVARALVAAGVLDDASFAAARAARLARAGRSRRATTAHLAGKGIAPALAETAVAAVADELSAAAAYARRRRIGPFRADSDADTRMRDLGALARAGFPRDVAERALALPAEEAAALVRALKRG